MSLMTHRSTSSTTVNTTCSTPALHAGAMLPPTYNHLDAAQRARFVKSSRKLGKVLGTTPCVLEALPPIPTTSSKKPATDMATKRCSVPPTPTSTFGEFISSGRLGRDASRPQNTSQASMSSEGESGTSSSRPFLAEPSSLRTVQHRKGGSDGLGPMPTFASEAGRHKPKRSQPVLRLPPTTVSNAGLSLPPRDSPTSLFPPDYRLDFTNHVDPSTTPLPLSPTSSISPRSSEEPPTPPPKSSEFSGDTSATLPDEVFAYPGVGGMSNTITDETRLRKRRMEKLMRHLGECVPSELVFGSARPRDAVSFSSPPTSPVARENTTIRIKDAQTRVMRRVSVLSGQRRHTYPEEEDVAAAECLSEPEPGNTARIQALLKRERSKIFIARGEGREKEKPLVEDDWTPEAYEDVVKRLRRLK